jgi:hypothetical protein
LLAFFVFQRFSRNGRLSAYLGYLALFFLALLTKETAVLLPVLIIIYSWTLGRDDKLSNRDRWLLIFGSLAVGFVWFLLRQLALDGGKIGLVAALASIIKNLPDAFIMSGKMILPFNLAVLPVTADSSFWLSLIGWPLIIIALIFSRQKRGAYLLFGAAWFLIFFLPPFLVSNDAPYFLEHRLYLPMIGFLIILGEINWLKNLNWQSRRVIGGAAVILMFLAILTFAHSRHFRSPLVFWTAAVKESPHSPLAQRNLGVMEYFSGDLLKAAANYRQALILNPNEPMAHNNLGVIYLAQKNSKAAAGEFQAELAVNPNYDKALLNLGDLYYSVGDTTQAASYWQAAERANPEDTDAASRLNNLGKPLR